MTEAGEKNGSWAQAWIDEQREKLRNDSTEHRELPGSCDFAALFEQLGAAWFSGYEKVLRTGFPGASIPLGWAREHEQAWRNLAVAQAGYRKLEAELLAKLTAVQNEALGRLERAVRARATEHRPLSGIRELYDLWIDCGEEAYAEVARSEEYCRLQAALGNASVQLRAQQQQILERGLKHFDLPTRAELNSVHRELRALRERLAELTAPHSRSSRRVKSATRTRGLARARAPKRTRK